MENTDIIMILSPHFDDAVLSTSNTLLNHSGIILLVTIFTKECDCSNLKGDYICYGDQEKRKKEDNNMIKTLNQLNKNISIITVYLDLPDDIFRNIFQNLKINQILKKKITDLTNKFNPKNILCPLGIGNHPDHILTYEVCSSIKSISKLIIFYCDYPYVNLKLNKISRLNSLKIIHKECINYKDINLFLTNSMYDSCPELIKYIKIFSHLQKCKNPINENNYIFKSFNPNLESKLKLILCYKSQIKPLFKNKNLLRQELDNFPEEIYLNNC